MTGMLHDVFWWGPITENVGFHLRAICIFKANLKLIDPYKRDIYNHTLVEQWKAQIRHVNQSQLQKKSFVLQQFCVT